MPSFLSSDIWFSPLSYQDWASLVAQLVKNPPAMQETLVWGLGRSPGERIGYPLQCSWASLVAQMVNNPSTCNVGDLGSIPGLGRCPGGGHGNPLQYSCLENPHGQRSLAGYSPRGHKESDTTEQWSTAQHIKIIFRSHLTSLSLTFKRKGSDETIAETSSSSNTSHSFLCLCDLHKKGPG